MRTESQPPRQRTSRARLVLAAGVAALIVAQPAVAAANTNTTSDQHVRVTDRGLRVLLQTGAAQSPALAALLAEIEAAPVLVFIDCGVQMPSRLGARLNFVTTVNGVRYVRVGVDCSLPQRHQVPLLAHELQHALEIASQSDVVDPDSMATYYEDIGFSTFKDGTYKGFETAAAVAMQRRVDDEIRGRSRAKQASVLHP